MTVPVLLQQQLRVTKRFAVPFVTFAVGLNGVFIVATTLLGEIAGHHGSPLTAVVIDVPLMIGLGLLYLTMQLYRRKRNAWLVTIIAYSFYLGVNVAVLFPGGYQDFDSLHFVQTIVVPLAVVALLIAARHEFVVRSDVQGFRGSLRTSLILLLVAFIYGMVGFTLFSMRDFHQQVSLVSGAHYTIDQFDLTTNHPIHAYSRRAHIFLSSLTFISVAAIVYVLLAFFQPIRQRFSDQSAGRTRMHQLLRDHPLPSEDYFKLWPHDKQYFFDSRQQAGVAFKVHRGIAVCLGDPAGDPRQFGRLLQQFDAMCYGNSWQPAFVHITSERRKLYESNDFNLQKIGQEAVVDIDGFQTATVRNKYFRHINNKFTKLGYHGEQLRPPHTAKTLRRLRAISSDWLSNGGRVERGFAMGYYHDDYMQRCSIIVVKDAAGKIQAFLNVLPADFDKQEATYDLLRYDSDSPGNINDYLLIQAMALLQADGYRSLNLGLCPLVGLDAADEDANSLVGGVLRFAYANGDRFYSFSGLHRFKAKYEPAWRGRYIAYQGGIPGFSRSMNALVAVMRIKTPK